MLFVSLYHIDGHFKAFVHLSIKKLLNTPRFYIHILKEATAM